MRGQLYLARPFGIERLIAEIRFNDGLGWEWDVREYDGHRWVVIDSGIERSDRQALRRLSSCLEVISLSDDYDPF